MRRVILVTAILGVLAGCGSGGGAVVSAFQPARNGRTGEPYQCRNGQQYGNGIVSRWPSVPGSTATGGIYPTQDSEDPEERGDEDHSPHLMHTVEGTKP